MKIKGKNGIRQNMLEVIKKEGRIGVKDVNEIKKLKTDGKLLESFFSIISRIQYQLQSNFHNKFHVNWKNLTDGKKQNRDINELWENFTKSIDKFHTIIFISYSTDLINKKLYQRLTNVRKLRNQIAHNLTYYEPEIFITKKEVELAIDECISLLKELEKIQHEIVFLRK